VFNNSALPKVNTVSGESTEFHGYTLARTAPYVPSTLAVGGERNARTRPNASTKLRHCSAFWTKASRIADNFNGFQKCAHLCGLTFELSGAQRRGPWAARTMINKAAARPRGHAVARPLERGVRPHFAFAPTRDTSSFPICAALTCLRARRCWHVPNCCTHGSHRAHPNELRVFCGGVFHAQPVFNSSALPRFNSATSKSTAFLGNTRALAAQYVTNSLAVDGEPDGCTRTSASTKFRNCSAFWTKANCAAENSKAFREYVHLCGLTFELSGRRRQAARKQE
jgi:hypothetical protein